MQFKDRVHSLFFLHHDDEIRIFSCIQPNPLLQTAATADASINKVFIPLIHLLQKDEREDGMRSEAEIVRSESLPKTEEPLGPDDADEDVGGAAVLWLPVDDPHVLNSRLGDVHWH